MPSIRPQPGILDIAPYKGGASHLPGVADVLKLSSNENPFGPAPAAVAALVRAAGQVHRYPSSDHAALRAGLAARHGLPAEHLICGAGSDELLALLCQAYAGPGDEVVHTEHGFAMYRIGALAAGARPVEVPERERVVDVEAVLAACTPRTRLVFIANPANPTGTMISDAELAHLAERLPESALLVIDGAYAEYVPGFDGGAGLVAARENVVMTRTFSKLYGLGGLRVGWAYAPAHVIDVLNRVRGPFNIGQPQLDAAEAALGDEAFIEMSLRENARLRAWLAQALAGQGVPSDPSQANFILARFENNEQAMACNAFFMKRGILVRGVAGYGLPHCLRITVGDEAGCARVAEAVRDFRAKA